MSEKNTETLGISVRKELFEKVKKDAEKSQRTVSNFLRIIIENHYKQKEILSEAE